jgi:hypothetical protein
MGWLLAAGHARPGWVYCVFVFAGLAGLTCWLWLFDITVINRHYPPMSYHLQ